MTEEKAESRKGMDVPVDMPQGVEARIDGGVLMLKGPKGENKRDISNPVMKFGIKDGKIIISTSKSTKREKKLVYTYASHLSNMIKGVTEGHKYVLKICSSHFPMNVLVSNNKLVIKNFVGEKYPRTLDLKQGVTVKVEGDKINVEGADKELAGTTASDIEKLTRRAAFDGRIFQDGIYMTNKDGKEVK